MRPQVTGGVGLFTLKPPRMSSPPRRADGLKVNAIVWRGGKRYVVKLCRGLLVAVPRTGGNCGRPCNTEGSKVTSLPARVSARRSVCIHRFWMGSKKIDDLRAVDAASKLGFQQIVWTMNGKCSIKKFAGLCVRRLPVSFVKVARRWVRAGLPYQAIKDAA